jgi:hypothetical protein
MYSQSQIKLNTDVDIKCYRGYEALFEMMSHRYIELIKARIQEKQNELKLKIAA